MLKKWAAWMLLACLLLCCALPAQARSGLSKQELYTSTMEQVRLYLIGEVEPVTVTQDGQEINLLDRYVEIFEGLGRYQNSAAFALYVSVLRDVEMDEYGEVYVYISQLRRNSAFCEFLVENELCSVDELESYVYARKAELDGDPEAAIGYYEQSINVLDSMARLIEMEGQQLESKYEKAGKFAAQGTAEGDQKAYELYKELAKDFYRESEKKMKELEERVGKNPPEQPTEVPATKAPATKAPATTKPAQTRFALTVTVQEDYIRLNWAKQATNGTYVIYRCTRSGSWQKLATVSNKDYYFDYSVNSNTAYTYYVAVSGNASLISKEITVTMGSTEKTTTTKPSVTTAAAAATTPEPAQWTEWSSWSTTAVSATVAGRQVETKVEEKTLYTTQYQYSRYRYIGKNGNWWYYPTEYSGSNYLRNGEWQYKTTTSPLTVEGTAAGKTLYEGNWYNQQEVQVESGTESVTYYRYRTLLYR